ncbi:MAG: hypothetical protein PHT91_02305 [Candidatus Nanoarchaeia archaeon]|nr:hypothetical protein [Candidatus Nanoarchaeia archaeon]MDD5054171.1 hypothetical protein [Candidatus Nanoarchaeia archaeon]MDD5499686.1 hypothetical protein [Candidatus Nanoarchaeia archaeon]
MKGMAHKILGAMIFIIFYYFNLFPGIINDFLKAPLAAIAGFFIAIIFSGGRINSKKLIDFGLSPDNDFHKKMKRSMIFHSPLFPLLAIIFFPHPIIFIASFFYSFHILIDLLNPLSFEGKRHEYFLIFVSVILFFVMIYS